MPSRNEPGRKYPARSADAGITLIEVLVVVALSGLLAALLLPAVQAARERARLAECTDHLKQIGAALHLHHETYGHFPTDGWGWQWMGEASRGTGVDQPGGWCFNVLPFLEQPALYGTATGAASSAGVLQSPLAVFYCPSRRQVGNYPYTAGFPFRNALPVTYAGKTDYAVCAGDRVIHTPAGPPDASAASIANYAWPPSEKSTGICYVRTEIRIASIRDGTSCTAMVGEKHVMRTHYFDGVDLGDDQAALAGDDADIRRWTDWPPRLDGSIADIQHFGAAHVTGCNLAACDGSVRRISYDVDRQIFRAFGNRDDGIAAQPRD